MGEIPKKITDSEELRGFPSGETLLELYGILLDRFGEAHWWPAETPLEVCVGAILTQNTAWSNVRRAIDRLRLENLLDIESLHDVSAETLAEYIRPAGYFNLKARRLKALVEFLWQRSEGNFSRFVTFSTESLRRDLLDVHGVGPETADSILLYAMERPVFVIDAYTKRIAHRFGWCEEDIEYHRLQRAFVSRLPKNVPLFNDFHAQFVRLGADWCKPKPRCGECPLPDERCTFGRVMRTP